MTVGRKPGTQKTGGRQKGTPNKLTSSLRQKVASFVESKLDGLEAMWEDELDAKERLQLLKDLLKYVLPPPRETEDEPEADAKDPLRELIESLKK